MSVDKKVDWKNHSSQPSPSQCWKEFGSETKSSFSTLRRRILALANFSTFVFHFNLISALVFNLISAIAFPFDSSPYFSAWFQLFLFSLISAIAFPPLLSSPCFSAWFQPLLFSLISALAFQLDFSPCFSVWFQPLLFSLISALVFQLDFSPF